MNGFSAALAVSAGTLAAGEFADFITVDLEDCSIAGNSAEDLLSTLVFSMNRSAVRDVVVGGRWILRDQEHSLHEVIVDRYKELHEAVWHDAVGRG